MRGADAPVAAAEAAGSRHRAVSRISSYNILTRRGITRASLRQPGNLTRYCRRIRLLRASRDPRAIGSAFHFCRDFCRAFPRVSRAGLPWSVSIISRLCSDLVKYYLSFSSTLIEHSPRVLC
jgi:hypothetical protein